MVSGKIENEAGWKKLTDSQFSKRHFFPQNTDSSCCGGALLSEEQCKLPPDRVKDNAEGNCPKCQKLLKDNPDLKRGYVEPSDDEVKEPKPSSKKTEPAPKKETTETSPKKVEPKKVEPKKVEPKKVEPKKTEPMKTEPKKVTEKTEKPEKKPAKAQVETPEKQKKEDKSTTEKTTEKKPSTETKEPKKPKTEKVEKEKKLKKEKPKKEPKLRDGVPTQVISPFTSVDELVSMAKTLDKAEVRSLVAAKDIKMTSEKGTGVGSVGSDANVISPHAIWNVSRGRLSSIVSDDYSLVQHQDVVKLVGKGLKAIDTEVYGTLKNVEDVMIIEVFFPKLHLKDDAKGIDVGGKIINSYNKSRAFKGHMMANRKVCSNGMYLRKLIPDVEFFEIHVGDLAEKIPEMVQEFFDQLKASTSKVNDIIKSAMEATIEFDSEEQIEPTIAGILSSPMHAKRIVNGYYKAEDKLNPTVWELYNSITNYISHSGIVESRVDDLSNKAEKLLDENYQIEILDPESEDSD